jgi:hypothetical protein
VNRRQIDGTTIEFNSIASSFVTEPTPTVQVRFDLQIQTEIRTYFRVEFKGNLQALENAALTERGV